MSTVMGGNRSQLSFNHSLKQCRVRIRCNSSGVLTPIPAGKQSSVLPRENGGHFEHDSSNNRNKGFYQVLIFVCMLTHSTVFLGSHLLFENLTALQGKNQSFIVGFLKAF